LKEQWQLNKLIQLQPIIKTRPIRRVFILPNTQKQQCASRNVLSIQLIKNIMLEKPFFKRTLFACLIVLASCQKSIDAGDKDPLDPANALQLQNVTYGTGIRNKADVYLPANRSIATTACIIMLHGGSWVAGDKADNNPFIPLLQKAIPGVAIINMNYTLGDGSANSTHPAQVNDIATLLRFVDSNAISWNIKKQYGLVGISAGAHLAMLYAYSHDTDRKTKLVASFVGPTNLTDTYYTGNPLFEQVLVALAGKKYAEDNNLYKAISPALNVNATTPPTFMAYGGADPLVPVSNPTLLAANLQTNGVPFKYDFYATESHELSSTAVNASLISLSAFWKLHVK
jgi:acetyl esterase/lipase